MNTRSAGHMTRTRHPEQELGIEPGRFHICVEKKCPDELDDNRVVKFFD